MFKDSNKRFTIFQRTSPKRNAMVSMNGANNSMNNRNNNKNKEEQQHHRRSSQFKNAKILAGMRNIRYPFITYSQCIQLYTSGSNNFF